MLSKPEMVMHSDERDEAIKADTFPLIKPSPEFFHDERKLLFNLIEQVTLCSNVYHHQN